jgi:hypothetical protein
MNSSQKDLIIEILQLGAQNNIENRHKCLAVYLKGLMKQPEGYGSRNAKEKRKDAIAAFTEFENGIPGKPFGSLSEEAFFEKYVLEAWINDDTPDDRTPLQKIIDGDSPV